MFMHAHNFNQDISEWDTSKVSNMGSMFLNAHSFNHDIRVWTVDEYKDSTGGNMLTNIFNGANAMIGEYHPTTGSNPDEFFDLTPDFNFFNIGQRIYVTDDVTKDLTSQNFIKMAHKDDASAGFRPWLRITPKPIQGENSPITLQFAGNNYTERESTLMIETSSILEQIDETFSIIDQTEDASVAYGGSTYNTYRF